MPMVYKYDAANKDYIFQNPTPKPLSLSALQKLKDLATPPSPPKLNKHLVKLLKDGLHPNYAPTISVDFPEPINPLTQKPYFKEPAPMADPREKFNAERTPISSLEAQLVEIFRLYSEEMTTFYHSRRSKEPSSPLATARERRLATDIAERVVELFLKSHKFDLRAAFHAFGSLAQKTLPKSVIDKNDFDELEYALNTRLRYSYEWSPTTWAAKVETLLRDIPMTPENLALYHNSLRKVFHADNVRARRDQPRIVRAVRNRSPKKSKKPKSKPLSDSASVSFDLDTI